MTWEPVHFEQPPPFTVTLLTVQKDSKTFGAGRCYVRFGYRQMPSIAVCAGDEKKVLLPEDAAKWLSDRGLPKLEAMELVASAARQDS